MLVRVSNTHDICMEGVILILEISETDFQVHWYSEYSCHDSEFKLDSFRQWREGKPCANLELPAARKGRKLQRNSLGHKDVI